MQTSADALTARIAYRLALVNDRLPVRPNSRSARRAASDRLQPLTLPQGERAIDPDDACAILRSSMLEQQSNWAASQTALACATSKARGAGAPELVSVAYLQGARFSLAEARRRPLDRDPLRQEASVSALAGLQTAPRIGETALRVDLTARLIETLLDCEVADIAEVGRQIDGLARIVSLEGTDGVGELALLEGLRARAALLESAPAKAADHARQALFYESQRLQPLRLAEWYMVLARAVPSQQEEYVLEAYSALEAIRPLMPQIDPVTEESTFALRMEPIFRAAVDSLLADQSPEADQQGSPGSLRILAVQQILESFRQAEIQSIFGSDCVPPRVPVSPDDLKPGEVLLYPVLLEDRVELIFAAKRDASTSAAYQRLTVRENASREEIESLVKELAFELGYGTDDTWEFLASDLYTILIEPIEHLLGPQTTLIIVPDDALRRLPFAALRDEEGTMLAEKALIAIAPSLAYTQPGTSTDSALAVVSASLSQSVDLPAGTFSALPATAAEAQMAARVAAGGSNRGIYLRDFTRDDLASSLAREQIDILHLATHASFNGRSDRSFVVSSDGAILLSELRQMIEANQTGGDLLTLIVLSACETALGDDQASMGLAGAAVQAGAESALASLWEVSDEGTAQLMEEFYKNYAQGQGRAVALRNAQLSLMRRGGALADPGVWAAFILLGAWR